MYVSPTSRSVITSLHVVADLFSCERQAPRLLPGAGQGREWVLRSPRPLFIDLQELVGRSRYGWRHRER